MRPIRRPHVAHAGQRTPRDRGERTLGSLSSNAALVLGCTLLLACSAGHRGHENQLQPRAVSGVNLDGVAKSTSIVRSLHERCGEETITLRCSNTACTQTALSVVTRAGKTIEIPNPTGMAHYSAVGIGCALSDQHTPYVVAQFGQLPTGCEFCEWFHILGANGHWLTRSVPPILVDSTLPGVDHKLPNNREFDALRKKLHLARPQMHFLD